MVVSRWPVACDPTAGGLSALSLPPLITAGSGVVMRKKRDRSVIAGLSTFYVLIAELATDLLCFNS